MEQGGTLSADPTEMGEGESSRKPWVSEKVRRQDATDRDEVGEHRKVNPKIRGVTKWFKGL